MFVPRKNSVAKIVMNTILSGAAAGLITTILRSHIMGTYSKSNKYDVASLCNGILAGLVGITAGCFNVQPWAAYVIGLITGLIYCLGCKLLVVLNLDDPVEATVIHGFCGMWGLIAIGIFDQD